MLTEISRCDTCLFGNVCGETTIGCEYYNQIEDMGDDELYLFIESGRIDFLREWWIYVCED